MKKNLFWIVFLLILASCSTSDEKPSIKESGDEFYENGQIKIQKLKTGDKDKWIFFSEDGKVVEEKYFQNGDLIAVNGYYPSGKKRVECGKKSGYRNGIWRLWYENGKIWENGLYVKGFPVGLFSYYDSTGVCLNSHLYVENSGFASIAFPAEMNLFALKDYLADRTDFQEMDNVEVAGEEYLFPELHWGESLLYFDERNAPDSLIGCMGGKIYDDAFVFAEKIKVGMKKSALLDFFQLKDTIKYNTLTIKDTTTMSFFEFQIENDKVKGIVFGGLYPRD
ncbi:MAG: hypothetical protein A2W91_17440 [Bacteroidetes bacterium GWF2_38_335]|nr:MAG: hypothetical protein A2W91_17440 [Bacteroidetes bacterium GWF2_38_335]OFY78081.1 MAG: hypothetical protein A2281_19015 [Bacteroidetes bacterium RIFOXYA12_FULL_38_20]HBS88355.1 hypothetical protein [Bacteroidales bacterium]